MSIQTDSTPMEDPKNPDTDHVFALYKILATTEQTATMRQNYLGGHYGFGHAKQALFEVILERFNPARERFEYFMSHTEEIDEALAVGAKKATLVVNGVLARVRKKIGY
jgi:tryptophanyl-tRNA synthetase